jgi:hypothetical protein
MTAEDYIRGFAELRERYPSCAVLVLPVTRAGAVAVVEGAAGLYNHTNAAPFQGCAAGTLVLAGVRRRGGEVPAVLLVHRPEGWSTEDGLPMYRPADFAPLEAIAMEPASEVPADI